MFGEKTSQTKKTSWILISRRVIQSDLSIVLSMCGGQLVKMAAERCITVIILAQTLFSCQINGLKCSMHQTRKGSTFTLFQ